jgi:hypothetical protein
MNKPRRVRQEFKKTTANRLLQLAERRGITNYALKIGVERGRPAYTLIVGDPNKTATDTSTANENPWDEVLPRHKGEDK